MTDHRAALWSAVHQERAALARDLADLTHEQWHTPAVCGDWNVHDVLAHLIDSARSTRLSFVRDVLRARFDFDRANADGVARERRSDPAGTLEAFRATIRLVATPPAPLETRLVEAYVHGEEIRRAVGLTGDYPAEWTAEALRYLLRTPVRRVGGRERATGLRLTTQDGLLDSGAGPQVHGTATALLLAVTGRPVRPGELTGPGAETLTARRA